MKMKGLCVGVCAVFSCLDFVRSLSAHHCGNEQQLSTAGPAPTRDHMGEGLTSLLWPLGGGAHPIETTQQPAQWPVPAATITLAPLLETATWHHASEGKG